MDGREEVSYAQEHPLPMSMHLITRSKMVKSLKGDLNEALYEREGWGIAA